MLEKSSSITAVFRQPGGVRRYYLECMEHHLECMALHLGKDDELTESLWLRNEGRAGTGDFIVGVCYRLPERPDRPERQRCLGPPFDRSGFTFRSPGPS